MFDAAEAERLSIVNRVFPTESLIEETMAFAEKLANGPRLAYRLTKELIVQNFTSSLPDALEREARYQDVAGASQDFREGVRAFSVKAPTVVPRALKHSTFKTTSQNSVGEDAHMNNPPAGVIGVVGAGTMGEGIAQVALQSGYSVVLFDIQAEVLQRAVSDIHKKINRLVDKGKLTRAEADGAVARLTVSQDIAHLAQAQLVIEAVPERLNIKRDIFRQLDRFAAKTPFLRPTRRLCPSR